VFSSPLNATGDEPGPLPLVPERNASFLARCSLSEFPTSLEEETMPVIILWAIHAIITAGDGIYLISHMY
jgi:hypothetical protein